MTTQKRATTLRVRIESSLLEPSPLKIQLVIDRDTVVTRRDLGLSDSPRSGHNGQAVIEVMTGASATFLTLIDKGVGWDGDRFTNGSRLTLRPNNNDPKQAVLTVEDRNFTVTAEFG